MADETQTLPPEDDRAEVDSLRQALGEMRREAEREVGRINQRLHEQATIVEGAATSATERLALQQERDSLQRALAAKETALDTITEECRRLEDVLEDQHLVFDGLRKEVERRDLSLKAAQDEVERLRQALIDLQTQAPEVPQPPANYSFEPPPPSRQLPVRSSVPILRPVAGVLVAGLIAMAIWANLDRVSRTGGEPSSPSPPTLAFDEGDAPDAETPVAVEPPPPESIAQSSDQAPSMPATRRDRLRIGILGPTLAALPGGTFRMGHNLTTSNDFGPARDVRISPFLMGVHEVTFEQFDRFARATGRSAPRDFGWGRGSRPVVGVSWYDARDYARWLSRQTGQAYRLPTEAEWEYAARAGGRGSYWWGFGLERGRALCFDCGSEWDNRSTAPVGTFDPSPFGLHDTAGNVMEWVADCYHPDYTDAPVDGRARLDRDCEYRVARGGAFNKPSSSMRAYVREHFVPETRLNALGFRVARDL
jgi:formylglycine-generating enzyme required for sulfatase activity